MRKRLAAAVAAAALAASLAGASGASGAVEFGSPCVADEIGGGNYTLATLSSVGALPLSAPSSGVVTKVRVAIEPYPVPIPILVKVLRPLGASTFSVVNEASVSVFGTTTANVRLPVNAGDQFGMHGVGIGSPPTPTIFYCDGGPADILGAVSGNMPVGSTVPFVGATDGRIPIVGVLEPDADKDGFGDETQDGCPQSAAVQAPCPAISIDSTSFSGGNSVTVLISTDTAAPVTVTGTVKLGKAGKATLKAGTKTTAPGKFTRFKLKFNAALKAALGELEPNKKLTLKITAKATNAAGQVSTDKLNTKLKGRG